MKRPVHPPLLPARMGLLLTLVLALVSGCGRSQPTDPMAQVLARTGEPREKKPRPSPQKDPAPNERKKDDASPPAPLTLSVLRVTDPRLPDLDDQQFQFFLQTLNGWSTKISQRPLEFEVVKEPIPIETYFKDRANVLKAPRAGKGPATLQFDVLGPDASFYMQGCIARSDPADLRAFFTEAPAELNSAETWAEYLVGDFRKKWAAFHQPHPPHPELISQDHPEYSQPAFWRALADDNDERADLIVTNAFIAGAESQMDLERIQRGGLMVGLWSIGAKKKNALGMTMVISVQPVLCRSPFVIDVPDRARPAVAAIYTWRYIQALWSKEPQVIDPLGTAVGLISGSQERR